jgi:hypothetical protein
MQRSLGLADHQQQMLGITTAVTKILLTQNETRMEMEMDICR